MTPNAAGVPVAKTSAQESFKISSLKHKCFILLSGIKKSNNFLRSERTESVQTRILHII